MVGAVLVKGGKIIGKGWHRRAGEPHAEIEALSDAQRHGHRARGATLYVTLEPCCTHGRTPPCTSAIQAAGIKRVIVGATDPNTRHSRKAFRLLKRAGISVVHGILGDECSRLNEAFNHWIVHRTPFVIVKAAMTLDGKIATASGDSKWITSTEARAFAMRLRQGSDAVLVGINTILADDPSLTFRSPQARGSAPSTHVLRRIILDSMARTPLNCKVVNVAHSELTTIVVSASAPKTRVAALAKRVRVLVAPYSDLHPHPVSHFVPRILHPALPWLLKTLGEENVTSLLVEGGGEVNASFLMSGLAHRVAFFYAPKVLGGRDSCSAVAGTGVVTLDQALQLTELEWTRCGPDLLLTARVSG
jgi:diaminohydroxyphosphoribosylaminopyrimidine deaminase/5-amino-6-(5-phosphoribosylamino)uracil reductase